MRIAKNAVVSIDYTLKDNDGSLLDSSQGGEPLVYLHGAGNIIPGLEEALDGKAAGDQVQISVPPDKAYGRRIEEFRHKLARKMFDTKGTIKPGMRFHADGENGRHTVTVVAVDAEHVTVDANHPMAGKTLNFEVRVIDVRSATDEERAHGHVHAAHIHHH